jgi:hypothetical protein
VGTLGVSGHIATIETHSLPNRNVLIGYPGVRIEPLTFCVPILIFIRLLDARSDAEGARSSLRFVDLPEEQAAFGHRGAVLGGGTLY